MAPTKPPSNAKAASAGHTSARGYRRQPGPPGDARVIVKREGGAFDDDTDAGEPPIGARDDDFSVRSWWMVDVDGDGGSSQGATALVKRCMRAYGWDLPKTRQILAAYRQFLQLKTALEDWDATLLSPCHLVDQMWHQHILDNFNYYHDMVLLCGRFVGHNPDGALDVSAKVKRDRFTRESLRQHFEDSYDEEIWDSVGGDRGAAGINEDSDDGDVDGVPSVIVSPTNNGDSDGDSTDSTIPVRLKDQTGHETTYWIEQTQQMAGVFRSFAGRKGVAVGDLRFSLYGFHIEPRMTPSDLALGDDDVIDVILRQSECDKHPRGDEPVTIRVKDQTGEETMFTIKRSTRMAKVFTAYAKRKGVTAIALRFTLDGERVGPDDTAETWELDDNDQIDVILAQVGC
ncbi:hypothetical protein ACHAXT_011439 [Thalassiosira profunda]